VNTSSSRDKPLALLIFPPVYDFAVYDLYIKPFALLRLARWFDAAGYDVELINYLDYREPRSLRVLGKPRRKKDGTGKFFRAPRPTPRSLGSVHRRYARYGILAEAAEEKLASLRPSIVLLSTGMTYWYPGAVEVSRSVRRRFPHVPIVAGGIYATLLEEHCLRFVAPDHVIAGAAFPALGRILSSLALPAPSSVPDEDFLLIGDVLADSAAIRLNNGCPYGCRYCASGLLSGAYQAGNPERIFQLVMRIHTSLGTTRFAFYDDALLHEKEAGAAPFFRRVAAERLDLRFYLPNAVHLSEIDEATAGLLWQAGVRDIRIGLESSLASFHERYGAKLRVEMLDSAVASLKGAGFAGGQITVYVLAGLPGQHRQDVEETIRYAARRGVRVSLAEYSPVPGSSLWQESVRLSPFPLAEEPLTHNNSLLPLRSETFGLQDLEFLKRLAHSLSAPRSR
jgi:radical SAM superfamily enzyme YgiQ (UPF0313 family)